MKTRPDATQRTLIELEPPMHAMNMLAQRPDLSPVWRREGAIKGFAGRYYYGNTGWVIEHCGHPTALWRYTIHSPAGFTYVGPNGKAWKYIAEAKAEVARLHENITAKRGAA